MSAIPSSRLFLQAGIGTYTSDVIKTPVVESVSKLLDEMIAWNLAEHIKGHSTTLHPLPSRLTNHSRWIHVPDAELSVLPALASFSPTGAYPTQLDRVGDRICIFGFSRGAFTARALAGMLQKVGLLPPCNVEQLPFAYAMYARDDDEGLKLSMQFKRTFSIDVRVAFVGVWYVVRPAYQSHTPLTSLLGTLSNPSA